MIDDEDADDCNYQLNLMARAIIVDRQPRIHSRYSSFVERAYFGLWQKYVLSTINIDKFGVEAKIKRSQNDATDAKNSFPLNKFQLTRSVWRSYLLTIVLVSHTRGKPDLLSVEFPATPTTREWSQ